jgi:hypothetical protein
MTRKFSLIRITILVIPAFLFVLTLGTCAHVFADVLNLSGGVPGVACANPVVTSGSASFSCPPSTAGGLIGTASGIGNLAMGVFGVSTSVTILPLSGGDTSANVYVTYNFNVAGVLNGTAQFDISAMGSLSSTICQDCAAQTVFAIAPGETVNGSPDTSTNTFLGNGKTNLIVDSPIGGGTVQLFFGLEATASCSSGPPPGNSCAASADFLDPTSITGASAYDASGNLVSGASFVSDSGFNPNAPATTPEPCSMLLFGTGLVAIIGTAKARLPRQT